MFLRVGVHCAVVGVHCGVVGVHCRVVGVCVVSSEIRHIQLGFASLHLLGAWTGFFAPTMVQLNSLVFSSIDLNALNFGNSDPV